MLLFIVFCIFLTSFSGAILSEPEREEDRCEAIIKEILLEDRTTVVDETSSRLHSTWLSQECEVRAGPRYVIRKYTFFDNGTFLLFRHHYAEESCSIATHTVVASGSIGLLSSSVLILGATEAKIELDTVQVIPLNRQVAHKFGRKVNVSCGGVEEKWRPYISQMVYERAVYSSDSHFSEHGPNYNSLQGHSPLRKRRGAECLDSIGIVFNELRLLRVEKKRLLATSRRPSRIRVELFLGGTPKSIRHRAGLGPTLLQNTPLLRADTTTDCPICGSISRGTEYSPPLLHEVPPLPALIGGLWLSTRCESVEGGFWSRRLFRVHSNEKRWMARWDYYADSSCTILLYAVTAAGSYVQRPTRRKRAESLEQEKASELTIYRHILRNTEASMARSFAAMLRGNRKEETAREDNNKSVGGKEIGIFSSKRSFPSGTTELDLSVTESLLIPVDEMITARCGKIGRGRGLTSWPRNCVPKAVEAPSILAMRAKLSLDWNGRYGLLLGSRDADLWEAPLRRCSETPLRNYPPYRSDFRPVFDRSTFNPQYGFFSSDRTFSSASNLFSFVQHLIIIVFYCICRFLIER